MKTFNEYLSERDKKRLDEGEYYADYDEYRAMWCVYHTYKSDRPSNSRKKEAKNFGCFSRKEDAEKEVKKLSLNDFGY